MPRRRSKDPQRQKIALEKRRALFARFVAAVAEMGERAHCDITEDDDRGSGSISYSLHFEAVPRHVRLFERTGNPLHAWQVYAAARRDKRAIPESALAYLDVCAARLLDAAALKAKSQAIYAAEAIGLKKAGRTGRKNVFREFHDHDTLWRAIALAAEVAQVLADGTKLDFAYDDVARAHGVSRTTVRRAYKTHIDKVHRAWTLLAPLEAATEKFRRDAERYREESRKARSKKSLNS